MAYANDRGGGQPQSQYFQSYDAFHFTQPPLVRRCAYTLEQKDSVIRLLNERTSAKTIVGQIGGNCSKSNPYRWRAEVHERELQRQRARQEWIRQWWVLVINFVGEFFRFLRGRILAFIFDWGFFLGMAEVIGLEQLDSFSYKVWILWKIIQLLSPILALFGIFIGINAHNYRRVYAYSVGLLWCYVIYENYSVISQFFM